MPRLRLPVGVYDFSTSTAEFIESFQNSVSDCKAALVSGSSIEVASATKPFPALSAVLVFPTLRGCWSSPASLVARRRSC